MYKGGQRKRDPLLFNRKEGRKKGMQRHGTVNMMNYREIIEILGD